MGADESIIGVGKYLRIIPLNLSQKKSSYHKYFKQVPGPSKDVKMFFFNKDLAKRQNTETDTYFLSAVTAAAFSVHMLTTACDDIIHIQS